MIAPEDIVERLRSRHRFWFYGPPQVLVHGGPHSFGRLVFIFKDCVISWRIYIQDAKELEKTAQVAVENFPEICAELEI